MNDKLYELEHIAKWANCYLNKMTQWNQGKIDLAVPGCDPPYRMSDDELTEAYDMVTSMLLYINECCDED